MRHSLKFPVNLDELLYDPLFSFAREKHVGPIQQSAVATVYYKARAPCGYWARAVSGWLRRKPCRCGAYLPGVQLYPRHGRVESSAEICKQFGLGNPTAWW